MRIEFRKQVVVNDGAGGMGAIRTVVNWPYFLPVPQIGDAVDCILGEDELGSGFLVNNRTILLEGSGPYVILTEFLEPMPGDTLGETLDRLLAELPKGWEREA